MYSLGIGIYLSVSHNHTLWVIHFWSSEELIKTENSWYPRYWIFGDVVFKQFISKFGNPLALKIYNVI